MFSDTSSGHLAVTAIIGFVAALVSPALALVRWIQERSTKHRYRDEMDHSQQLSRFIESCPELFRVSGTASNELPERIRDELKGSLTKIQALLDRKVAKEAPLTEMAWPRRWFLLYAARSGWATVLHTAYQLLFMFFVVFIIAVSSNEDLDVFDFYRVIRGFTHPFFVGILAFWGLRLAMIWYAATTKDRWDGALPKVQAASSAIFLRRSPTTIPDLMARLFLVWSVLDIVIPLLFGNAIRTDMNSLMASAPDVSQFWASIEKAIPATKFWETFASWLGSTLAVAVAYLWSLSESKACGVKLWLPFPRRLRVLYPSSGWLETFAQLGFLMMTGFLALRIFWVAESLQIIWPLLTEDNKGSFLVGVASGNAEPVMFSVLSLYACYRIGLISYRLRSTNQKPASFAVTASQ